MAEARDRKSAVTWSVIQVGWLRPIARFAAWWFSLFALLGPLSVCPSCGQSGCPEGPTSAGVLGGVGAAFISGLHWIFNCAKRHRRSEMRCTRERAVGVVSCKIDGQKGNRMTTESVQAGRIWE